jgi:porin
MRTRIIEVVLGLAAFAFALAGSSSAALPDAPPVIDAGAAVTPANATPAPPPSWLDRDTLTDDWGGVRTWLKERGITIKPRLTQFYQGLTAGDGPHSFDYAGKADVWANADLGKLGLWNGFSMTVHAEYNFGRSVNAAGGTMVPVNTALAFPGMDGADAFDFSSVYFGQTFGDNVSLLFGKLNIIDLAATRPFMGGAGIDAFWNTTFAAPPSGTVPPYLFGALLSVRTEQATFGLWVYDPDSFVNRSVFDSAFANGVTFRGTVDFPVTIGGRSGHQGLVALYSTQSGTDLESLGDIFLPPPQPGTVGIKNSRYYFAYTFDQSLYQAEGNPEEGFGLFGQFGFSDGNPNRLYSSFLVGVGGVGLIPGRNRDNWGVGYYYDTPSKYLKESLAPIQTIRNEQGLEIFYNFAVTRWFTLGVDLQVIRPALAEANAVFPGLRAVIRF